MRALPSPFARFEDSKIPRIRGLNPSDLRNLPGATRLLQPLCRGRGRAFVVGLQVLPYIFALGQAICKTQKCPLVVVRGNKAVPFGSQRFPLPQNDHLPTVPGCIPQGNAH